MWMVAAYRRTHSPSCLTWSEGRRPSGTESAFIKSTGSEPLPQHHNHCRWCYKSVFSFLRQLSTRHCSHLLLSVVLQRRCCWAPGARRCRSIYPARTGLSSKPAARRFCGRMIEQTDRQTDGRSTVSFPPAPHTMRAM